MKDMRQLKVKIKKTNEKGVIPSYATQESAGADLYACLTQAVEIKAGETVKIPTGISIELPCGTVGLIYARSGLATKENLAPANKVGVIDSDYRGEIFIPLHNFGTSTKTIQPMDRIAQLVVTPFYQAIFEESAVLQETVRGAGGFGSTGKQKRE